MAFLNNSKAYQPLREQRSKYHAFDEKSGLVYTKVVVRAAPMRADWVWKTRGSTAEIAAFRSPGTGSSTLLTMAIRKACLNVVNLTPESLVGLDWQAAKWLWESIVALEIDSLYAWRIFAAAYPDEMNESLKRRYQVIRRPDMVLPDYTKHLCSESFQWITFLTLSHITCSYSDLINLSKFSNLGALTIGHGVEVSSSTYKGIDDSVVRAWSRAAADSGAFSALQVFACRMQLLITRQTFDRLTEFPALALFLVESCSIGPRDKPYAENLGWGYSTGKDLSEVLAESGMRVASWNSTMHACFQKATDIRLATDTSSLTTKIDTLPRLHFAIGKAPIDAVVDVTGDRSLRCFHRAIPRKTAPPLPQPNKKRPLENTVENKTASRKLVRPVKKQKARDFMTEFGF
ncbi:hypothetical protein MMC26_007028 [Xylographa opegraphella]|nr:hypothetical protein [Xylographa opegraphella]